MPERSRQRELFDQAIARIEAGMTPKSMRWWCAISIAPATPLLRQRYGAGARRAHGRCLESLVTVKESFNVGGLPTSWGFPHGRDWKAAEDAVAVTRLKQAGAIIIGKTNLAVAIGDWQSYNSIYGVTNNPWDVARTAGGSSGGSAAALACGYVPLELGSDISSSLRMPAHVCGVFSHKPSSDLVRSAAMRRRARPRCRPT